MFGPVERKDDVIKQAPLPAVTNKLCTAVLLFGDKDHGALARYCGMMESHVKELLLTKEFTLMMHDIKSNPERILPTKAEIYARLTHEMTHAARSTERQKAAEMLLNLTPNEKSPTLKKYEDKKAESA